MNPKSPESPTSRAVAEAAVPERSEATSEAIPERSVNPSVKNADLPKGIDKPNGELESVNDNLQRVEKRTTS